MLKIKEKGIVIVEIAMLLPMISLLLMYLLYTGLTFSDMYLLDNLSYRYIRYSSTDFISSDAQKKINFKRYSEDLIKDFNERSSLYKIKNTELNLVSTKLKIRNEAWWNDKDKESWNINRPVGNDGLESKIYSVSDYHGSEKRVYERLVNIKATLKDDSYFAGFVCPDIITSHYVMRADIKGEYLYRDGWGNY